MKALIFHKMDTEEISNRYVAPCFVNGLEAYDGKINLRMKENMILNEFAMKLCLEHEVNVDTNWLKGIDHCIKKRNLFCEVHNQSQRRRYDLDFGDILDIEGIKVPPFVCKMGKNNRKQLEKYQLIYSDMGPSLSTGKLLTQEEAKREAPAVDICRRYSLLEEERPLIETKTSLDTTESEIDDEEEYSIQRNKFGAPIYRPKPTRICDKEDNQEIIKYETVEEAMLPRIHHLFLLWEGCKQAARSRYNTKLAQLLPRLIYLPCVMDWNVLNQMGCGEAIDEMLMIKLFVASTNEEIFTSEAWTNAFNIDERIYSELCHEFYSTYEFDEVCVADELKTRKIIKFRLCERAFSWTLLDFSKSREENLSLSRSHASTIRNPVLRVFHKMITYGLYQKTIGWIKRKGAGSQKESMICCRHFVTRIAKRKNLLSKEVLNSLSAPIYCRALDTTTLRELINSEGRPIHEAPELCVPRVAIPRRPRASLQDFYERMGSMKIRQEAIERMSYKQSYHWDMYARVFEHMARVYSVTLQGAYNPPGYDQQ
nr:hypothetical protein [Tanacetum cinerariifolium]